ncbi:MAG TPA: DUF1343 domain-containing protein [Candidatus Acidoferrum sp.]|nr:DUF1343 domain-containing protein [Candidatus Acidoferrum sp.]
MKHRSRVRANSYTAFIPLIALSSFLSLASPNPTAAQKHTTTAKGKSHAGRVQTGLDVLEAEKFAALRGKHVGLITNHTGLDFQGRATIEVLAHAPGVQLVALFSPEHGIAGHADEKIVSSKDASTGLPIFSLYGDHLRPTDEMLQGIDALVFDVQDAGVRFYTYTSTMAYCMEEAAKRNIAFFVLDRPNPLNGEIVEGPMLDAEKTAFVAYYPLPVRYALTIGELAQFFNTENHINAQLKVIPMKSWHRNYFFESTGLRWIPPSPNLRTLKGAILYPGLEILQNAGVSVGRGTESPFEEFGAPWINGEEIAQQLNEKSLPGVHFVNQPFIPVSGLYAGQHCGGVGVRVTDRAAVRSMRIGLEIASELHKKYPDHFDVTKILLLLGNDSTIQQLQAGTPPDEIIASWAKDLAAFDIVRRRYFLYK